MCLVKILFPADADLGDRIGPLVQGVCQDVAGMITREVRGVKPFKEMCDLVAGSHGRARTIQSANRIGNALGLRRANIKVRASAHDLAARGIHQDAGLF